MSLHHRDLTVIIMCFPRQDHIPSVTNSNHYSSLQQLLLWTGHDTSPDDFYLSFHFTNFDIRLEDNIDDDSSSSIDSLPDLASISSESSEDLDYSPRLLFVHQGQLYRYNVQLFGAQYIDEPGIIVNHFTSFHDN